MKRTKSESERENASPATRPAGNQRETPGPNRRDDPVAALQRAAGNQAVQRLVGEQLRPELGVGRPDDEREADRVAEAFPSQPSSDATTPTTGDTQRRLQSERTPLVQRQARGERASTAPPVVTEAVRSPGRPLDAAVRSSMEAYFGRDFSGVRVHTGPEAAKSASAIDARAYTVGRDVVFQAGEYAPSTSEGRRLIAHELTHVLQQSRTGPQVQCEQAEERSRPAEQRPRVAYDEAARANARYAETLWGKRLAEYRPAWAKLWENDRNAFADAVAAFQVAQGFRGRDVDGVLGPDTWAMVRPFGELVTEHPTTRLSERARQVCLVAARERLEGGYRRKTRERLPIAAAQRSDFRIILNSIPVRQLEVDERYRGTGAAGAMVYLGLATFVDETDIWSNKALEPGAPLQVWGSRSEFDQLRAGEDIHPYGTAAIFLRYEGDEKMRVLHFDREEVWRRNRYEVWIGANLMNEPPAARP